MKNFEGLGFKNPLLKHTLHTMVVSYIPKSVSKPNVSFDPSFYLKIIYFARRNQESAQKFVYQDLFLNRFLTSS